MASKRKLWTGTLKPEDIEPALLARFRQFYERYLHFCDVLPTSAVGTGNQWQAYEKAVGEMQVTGEERAMLKKLPLKETFPELTR
ncbi:hypothetical protein BH20ACI2_BH20ACI2_20260 [soil metagenome]